MTQKNSSDILYSFGAGFFLCFSLTSLSQTVRMLVVDGGITAAGMSPITLFITGELTSATFFLIIAFFFIRFIEKLPAIYSGLLLAIGLFVFSQIVQITTPFIQDLYQTASFFESQESYFSGLYGTMGYIWPSVISFSLIIVKYLGVLIFIRRHIKRTLQLKVPQKVGQ